MGAGPSFLFCTEGAPSATEVCKSSSSSSARLTEFSIEPSKLDQRNADYGGSAIETPRQVTPQLTGGKPMPGSRSRDHQEQDDRAVVPTVQNFPQFNGDIDMDLGRDRAAFLDDVIAQIRAERQIVAPGAMGDAPVEDSEAPADPRSMGPKESSDSSERGPRDNILEDRVIRPLFPNTGAQSQVSMAKEDDQQPRIAKSVGTSPATGPLQLEKVQATLASSPLPTPRSVPAFSPRGTPQGVHVGELGSSVPGKEERRWIEAAVRRMFQSLGPSALDELVEAFREWKLPKSAIIVKQAASISTGPGLCVLIDGVVDVLHLPRGATESEKVCTYDRCGQCFGELELFYDSCLPTPRGTSSGGRKLHWATMATRTPVILWIVDKNAIRGTCTSAVKPPSAPANPPKPTLPDEHRKAEQEKEASDAVNI